MVTPTGTRAADILIHGETIAALADHRDPLREGVILDVGNRLVLPGLIDFRGNARPPSSESTGWYDEATASAAPGGVTTIVELPTGDWPTTVGPRPFDGRLAEAPGHLWVDCGLVVDLVPGGASQVASWMEAGALGIVTIPDRPTGDSPPASATDLRHAMPAMAREGRPLLFPSNGGPDRTAGPDRATLSSMIALCREHGCRLHVLGLSTADGLSAIADARAEGLSITADTWIEHLIPTSEVRSRSDSSGPVPTDPEGLWEGLRLGTIDAIGSGHGLLGGPGICPTHPALPFLLSQALRRGFTPGDLARWTARRPAEILGLSGRKGSIEAGSDADFAILDPEVPYLLDEESTDPASARPPRMDGTLKGQVVATILRGQLVYESGRLRGRPQGIPILRLDETERLPNGLERLNNLGRGEALDLLRGCCGSSRWAWRLLALRPFRSMVDLLDAADRVWATLDRADRQEAFAAHPRVAAPKASRPGALLASFFGNHPPKRPPTPATVLDELAGAAREYEARFEFTFVNARADLAPVEVLALLRQRARNDPDAEYRIASGEQAEITRQRLRRLILGS